jgi:hypothetical protein
LQCRRKRRFEEEQQEQQEEERLDLEQRQPLWVYSYYQAGDRDDVSPERPMMILRRPEWCCSCSYFHEGDPDLAAPPESQGSVENHLRQPCEQGKSLGKP